MGASRFEVTARELLKQYGEFQRVARHGELWLLPGGRLVTLPSGAPSETMRAWKNCCADVRRVLRQQGLIDQHEEAEVEEEEKAEHAPDLEAMGIYVQTTVEEVRRETHEITMDPAAIAVLMGFKDVSRAVLTPEGGKPSDATVTMVVCTEKVILREKTLPLSTMRYHKSEERAS